jgi:3',5'-cyclic AMP phosphodiesterase CpdA
MLRIAHISDIHFGMENIAAVEATRAWLQREACDAIVVTGDITSFGDPAEFQSARDWLGALPREPWVVPGNHDTPYMGVWERLTRPFERYEAAIGPPDNLHWTSRALSVAGVNTARGVQIRLNWSKGEMTRAQARAALRRLAGLEAGALRVIACHHPLAEMVGGPMTARVRGGERAARAFCEGGVDLILTGHIHAPFAMALPHGDGFTYAVGAGTLSLRERSAPAGFNIIEADQAEIRVNALAWTGAGLETWRAWRLPRRSFKGSPVSAA